MTLTYGPNLGLLVNGAVGEAHYAELMKQWRGQDALTMPNVKGYLTNTPPGSPVDGDCYIIGAAPTGAWAGQSGKVSRYSTVAAAWEFFTPKNGWMLQANSARETYRYTSSAWEIFYQEGTWTGGVRGGATAGTYELNAGASFCTFTLVGRNVMLNGFLKLAGAITGGGSGDLTITGSPFPKRSGCAVWGSVAFDGITFSAGKQLAAYFGTISSSSSILIWESSSGAAVSITPISGVHAGNIIAFSITFEM